jgi:dihydroorotate dehydrogenase electron transfer subunit
MSIQEKCRILDHGEVAPQHFKLTLSSAYISNHGSPGQFVNIKVSDGTDPLLRRPFSIHRVSKDKFELLYEVVGKGTDVLSKASVGSELDVLGPLGNGFKIDKKIETAILVGGGMGVAPLLYLAEKIKAKDLYILIGAKTRKRVLAEKEFKKITDQVIITTDDGSYGNKGFVSDALIAELGDKTATIFACGPNPMLEAVSEIAFQKKCDCQVSMEQKMACGIGTCLGCVIKTKSGYKKVCDDGPVFNGNDITW